MAEVVVKIVGDTKQATKNVDELNDSLEDTGKAAEKASEEINVAEGRIKALGGAINIVGGSVEVLAGGLALSGALTEEQAERFEAAAVGALVFADGTKRVFEGVKELKEGIQLLGGAQKIATVATKAFGIAVKVATGPVGIALAAITAIGAAIVLLKDRFEVVNKVAKFFGNIFKSIGEALGFSATEAEKFQAAQAELAKDTEFQLKLLQAQGASTDELIKKERELLTQRKNSFKAGTEERIAAEQELALFEAKVIADRAKRVEDAEQKRRDKIKENAEKRKAAIEAAEDLLTETRLSLLDDEAREVAEREIQYQEDLATLKAAGYTDFTALDEAYRNDLAEINDRYRQEELDAEATQTEKIKAEQQKRIDDLNEFDAFVAVTEEQQRQLRLDALTQEYLKIRQAAIENGQDVTELDEAFQAKRTEIAKEGADERSRLEKFFASETAEAISQSLATASNLITIFSENIDDSTKEGFEKSKKYKIAETVTSTIQAAFDAYKSLIGVPIVGPVLGPAAALGALAAGKKAISDIQNSTFDSTSVPGSIGGGGVQSFNVPLTTGAAGTPSALTAPTDTAAPAIPSTTDPVRAYVLVNDVNSAQAANASINRRRSLNPG
jgi:hypothetical protein